MLNNKYLNLVKKEIMAGKYGKDVKFFIFGSSLRKKQFGDVDVGVMGKIKRRELRSLKEKFIDSRLPYDVDIIDFNKASKSFTANVFNDKILWIKR